LPPMEWWKLLFYPMAAELADLTTPAHNIHRLAILFNASV